MQAEYTLRRPVIELDVSARAAFIMHTYGHLAGAIGCFVLLEMFFFQSGLAASIYQALAGVNWLFVLGGFLVVGWLASRAAHQAVSRGVQYLALGGFVLAEAIIFVPLLYTAQAVAPGAIESAASVTIMGFVGLTLVAYFSRKDFSFLGSLLRWGFVVALVLIAASVLFGLHLGTFFSVGMIALAGGAILYDTSNVLHRYPVDRHVGAALQLFASVALLFWYVLSIFIGGRD